MHQVSIMGILEGRGQLYDQIHYCVQGNALIFGITVPQGSPGHVFHHQERQILLTEAKVEQWHNMLMAQANRACFIEERFEVLALGEWSLDELDSYQAAFAEILSLVNLTEAACTKSAQQTIVTDELAAPILRESHLLPPPCKKAGTRDTSQDGK